jgi:beta-lactamase regulating signal transducer with metallopeptidase domain
MSFPPLLLILGQIVVHTIWQGGLIAGLHHLWAARPGRRRHEFAGQMAFVALLAAPAVTATVLLAEGYPSGGAGLLSASHANLASVVFSISAVGWLCGFAWSLIRVAADVAALLRLREEETAPPDWLSHRFGLMTRGFRRSIRLLVHPGVDGPLAFGVLRAVIYLPASAVTQLSPDEIEAVLAHELAHLRRHDFLWNLLQTVVECVYFYHPMVHGLGRNLRMQRELRCDDAAVAWCGRPLVYASALHALEQHRPSRHAPLLAHGLLGHGDATDLLYRIRRILGAPASQSRVRYTAPVLAGVAAALVGLSLSMPPSPEIPPSNARVVAEGSALPSTPPLDLPRAPIATRPAGVDRAPRERAVVQRQPGPAAAPAGLVRADPDAMMRGEMVVSPEQRRFDEANARADLARMTPAVIAAERARDAWITRNDPRPPSSGFD